MSRKLTALVISLLLAFPLQTFAQGETSSLKAGITPDSLLYQVDKLTESIQLLLTFDVIGKAELLSTFSQERLAESQAMMEDTKDDLTEKTMEAYKETLSKAMEYVEKAIEEGQDVSGIMDQIVQNTQETSKIIDQILQALPKDEDSDIKDSVSEALDNVVNSKDTLDALEDSTTEEVTDEEQNTEDTLKNQVTQQILTEAVGADALAAANKAGLSVKQIMAAKYLAEKTGKPIDEVLSILIQHDGALGETVQVLGYKPYEVFSNIKDVFATTKEQIKTAFAASKQSEEKPSDELDQDEQAVEQEDQDNNDEDVKKDTEKEDTGKTDVHKEDQDTSDHDKLSVPAAKKPDAVNQTVKTKEDKDDEDEIKANDEDQEDHIKADDSQDHDKEIRNDSKDQNHDRNDEDKEHEDED